jgi:hypothetical protein
MAIEVIITDTTQGDRVPVSTKTEPTGTTAGQGVSQAKAEGKADKGAVAAGLVAVQQVMPYVNAAVNFGVSQIQATTGSAEMQQRAQILSGMSSTAISIGLGAAVGGVPGAAISAALSALQESISFIQNSITINTNRRIERESIDRKTSRLGQSVNRSRTGGVS